MFIVIKRESNFPRLRTLRSFAKTSFKRRSNFIETEMSPGVSSSLFTDFDPYISNLLFIRKRCFH